MIPCKQLLLLLLLQLLLFQSAYALYFEAGFDHHYTYASESDILGLHNVTTIIKLRIRFVNQPTTGGSLHMLMVDSFVQRSEKGYVADNPLHWKLDHKFFFTVGNEGIVTLVHFHPEEKDEVLSLKKVLASTLSTNVQIEPGQPVTVEEEDHAGILEQEYSAERLSDGVRVTRGHKSSKDVHRSHNKTVHLSWKGTPLHVDSTDNITLRSSPTTVSHKRMEGEAELPEEQEGEVPNIASVSKTTVKLVGKSEHHEKGTFHKLDSMKRETLQIRKRPKQKVRLSSAESEIQKYIQCIHAIPNKFDRNRTECVNKLRTKVASLNCEDFIKFGEAALSKECKVNDVMCIDERNLFLDIISREGSPDAQLMMLNNVLMHPNATEDDIRRCLFHCIAIKSPVMELVQHVEDLCFAEDASDGKTPPMSKNRKRACLSLGAMAKSLHDKNATVADRIVERLEDWLQHHNESKSVAITKPRRKKSIIQHDSVARNHIETKMVLLQSLGNAGKKRSIQHIKSYMAPNVGITAWRRAAIHSLRHFDCDESAHGLLVSATNDDDEVVRKVALKVLEKHPRRDKFTTEHENVVLSKHYTYPVVARVRRSLLQALEVNLQTPGIEWEKVIGNHAIGASFGLQIRNILDLKLGLLDGRFSIDVYDGAYAEAHISFINVQVELLKAYICFKGHIQYDLNVLKDFSINGISDLVNIYDKIVSRIIGPIQDAVTALRNIIVLFRSQTLTYIINTLAQTVKDMPLILGNVDERFGEFEKNVYSIEGSTIIQEIKVVVQQMRNFVDGIKTDLLKFYNDIVDIVSMELPYVGKKIVEVYNLIVEGMKSLFDNPMQAITGMGRAINDFKMAITMIVDVKMKIEDACKFLKGRVAEWLSANKQIPKIMKRLVEAFNKMTAPADGQIGDMTSVYSDGVGQTKPCLHRLEEGLKQSFERVREPISHLVSITKPFMDQFKTVADVIKALKWGYNKMKSTFEVSKALVQKVFGPKFHKGFPTQRRPKRGSCLEGVWPSSTHGQYNTIGVDLLLGVGQSIKLPVNGILQIRGNNRIIIKPTESEFVIYEIVIENINVLPHISDGKMYPAGTKIGRASKAPKCEPNFIHVSLREASDKELPDADYKYTDPGTFLDRIVPIPKWIQECNDHEFRYMSYTFDIGSSNKDEEPNEEKEQIERKFGGFGDFGGLGGFGGIGGLGGNSGIGNFGGIGGIGNIGDIGGSGQTEIPQYRPDDPNLYDQTTFDDSLRDSFKREAKKFTEFYKTALFVIDGPKIPNILNIINLGLKNISWIINNIKDHKVTSELNSVVDNLCSKMTAIPKRHPFTFGVAYAKNLLKFNGLSAEIGDMSKLSDALTQMAQKACPLFRGSIAVGFGHICTAQEKCLGITCSIPLPNCTKTEYVQIGVSAKPDDRQIGVTVNNKIVLEGITEVSVFIGYFYNPLNAIDAFGDITFFTNSVNPDQGWCPLVSAVCRANSSCKCFCLVRSESHAEKLLFGVFSMTATLNKTAICSIKNGLDTNLKFRLREGFLYTVEPVQGEDDEFHIQLPFTDMKLTMVTSLHFKNGIPSLSAEAKLCNTMLSTCLPPIEIFNNIRFKELAVQHRLSTTKAALCTSLRNLTLPKLIVHLSDYQLLSKDVTNVIDNIRAAVVKELLQDPVDTLGSVIKEFKDKEDFCLKTNIPVPPSDIEFFDGIDIVFMAGPIPLNLGFGGGGSIGLGVKLGLCVLSMKSQVALTPWIGGMVWGSLSVNIGFAKGGIRLVGYLLETRFPILAELEFSKFPIDVGAKMDLIFTPLRLQLKAFAEIRLFFKTITVFDKTIWEYSVPTIRKNIFNYKNYDNDKSPPDVMPVTIDQRRKRESHRGCIVRQIPGRPYYNPAFNLEMHAKDEVSDIKLFYAIGTHRGGTNLVDWTEMGGATLLAPSQLPGGIPLYWTVKAKNSQGLEAIQQCSLDTYDSTLPDGRVEHAYKYSSHPSKLLAFVVVSEDSALVESQYKAVGFSPGQFGSQLVDWTALRLDISVPREGVSGFLKHFTVPREGKLVAWILQKQNVRTPEICAQKCIEYGQNCVSFDYEFHSETCDLHDVVQGANAYLRLSGTYSNYERLGSGYNSPIEYNDLPLKHGITYFINTRVTNVLGYNAFLIGEGTLIDFTPPEPGTIRNAYKDVLKADKCNAAITQHCNDVTWKQNHRLVIDGTGSETVYNGHEPLFDHLYTLTNHFVTANWKGFHDDESGIWGYTWAVGRQVCDSDVIQFEDPYAHLTSKRFWTDSAFQKGIHLKDGAYYVTVQALNGAELGGSLVTTVCHSMPFIVDTTSPVFHKITDIIYDEDFDLIAIYYNATDSLSGIAKAEMGLGKTKYDVQLKPYSLHASMNRSDPFVAVEDLGLQEGIPAWLRIRVTNHVDLFTAGHGDEPILIDRSPPIAGHVLDGDRLRQDLTYQADDTHICAQWVDFYDPESGLSRFLWGVGTSPKADDVVKFHNLTHYDKSSCALAPLKHNRTYYSTVFAFNNALNSKSTNSSSDGVFVDTTLPIPGAVFDGKIGKEELFFTSETVSKFANWRGYHDIESGIAGYKVDVFINNEHKKTFDVGTSTEFEDHTISMNHLDDVYFDVHGINGAELEAAAKSDGFLVDHTPPVMTSIADNNHGSSYQSENDAMHVSWDFYDGESYIREYRTVIYEKKFGVKQQFWPSVSYNSTKPPTPSNGKMAITLGKLMMKDGAVYTLHVTALNGALLTTSHETAGITVDTSPPPVPQIKIGLPKEEEYVDDDNRVFHNNQHAIRFSWRGRDSQSGIEHYILAIGTVSDPESISPWTDYGTATAAFIQNINFQISDESGITYIASIKAINGARLESLVGNSKQIVIQKANIPGLVFDGRTVFQDEMYTVDWTSIAASFYGFESASCDITGYEWAVGTTEYGTDVLSYTDYGVVMLNETHGQAQIHQELYEDTTYYITIRALTGCREEYILATSDGITLDMTPPDVFYSRDTGKDSVTAIVHDVIFQNAIDTILLTSNVTDTNSIQSSLWALGSLPLIDDRHTFTDDFTTLTSVVSQQPGQATFLTTDTIDKAGNRNITSSVAVMSDNSAPKIKDLVCTQYMSYRKSLFRCSWDTLVEYESMIDELKVSLSTNDGTTILNEHVLPRGIRTFSRDLHHELYMKNVTTIYVTFVILNVVGQKSTYGRPITIDNTKPNYERLDVVTSLTLSPAETHQKCQLPKAYTKLRVLGIEDKESEIDNERFQISIGLKPYGTDILSYIDVEREKDGTFFVDGFTINVGTIFYATLRVYNKAGLYADVTSDSVVVSQSPFLTVMDGNGEEDVDFQSLSNVVQGRWEYSDPCPIVEAFWSLKDLTDEVLFDFQSIQSSIKELYNDEVSLEPGKKYIITVKTIDALDRIKIAHSDGFTVRIQPPFPGYVRDGLDEDINYQHSNTNLSANWDQFGDNSKDPTQSIHHYEVAIGNDRRYEKTRSNVHYFVNVGLETSYTFKYLNLTQKLVKYYITVRSYSMAGGYAEGYSNGVRVGYIDELVPGTVSVNAFQSHTDSIAISWTGFQSDIDIVLFKVGISSLENVIPNDTLKCSFFKANASMYDVSNLTSVGFNEYVNVQNLSLQHGQRYYVTVVAMDEAGKCIAVRSNPVLIDTTPPNTGLIFIHDVQSAVISFATSSSKLSVSWTNVYDPESGITENKVSVMECNSCYPNMTSLDCVKIAENIVHNDRKTVFYDLELYATKSYVVNLVLVNGAHLISSMSSSTILIDSSPPLPGEVKITRSWDKNDNFQHSTKEIKGFIALAGSHEQYLCRNQIQLFPPSKLKWSILSPTFSNDFLVINSSGIYLGIGYSSDLSSITKSGIISETQHLTSGNYSFVVRVAAGKNIITTVAFLSHELVIPFTLPDKPEDVAFDFYQFDNVSGLVPSNDNGTDRVNSTSSPTTTAQSGEFVPIYDNESNSETEFKTEQYGFGIHFLGYKIENSRNWWHVFWARSKITNVERWFRLPFDSTSIDHEYTLLVKQKSDTFEFDTDLVLFAGNEEIVSISGFKCNSDMKFSYLTWNENDYQPPLESIFHPFYSEASVTKFDIPDSAEKPCLHGRGFYDGESGIKELYVGVSDSKNEIGNIVPLHLYKYFCFPCNKPCDQICETPCKDTYLTKAFTLVPLLISNLSLKAYDANDTCFNASSGAECNSTAFYINAKIINFAGTETLVYSNGVQLDITPPEFEYVKCTDPQYNEDAPTSYISSNSTFGAYWDCREDNSQIEYYKIKVISESGQPVMNSTFVGLKTSVEIDIGNGTFENDRNYIVQVIAMNTAGLTMTSSCSVHVYLFPPDVSLSSAIPLYSTPIGNIMVETDAYWTTSQTSIGLEWRGDSEDTEVFDWKVGTAEDKEDIFPLFTVGQNNTGSVAIVNGKLEVGGITSNTTMADFRDRTILTTDELAEIEVSSDREKAFFFIEPGRCMYQSLYAVGYSHLKSKLKDRTVCIRRPEDVSVDVSESQTIRMSKSQQSAVWKKNVVSEPEIVIEAKVVNGGISCGTLNQTDKKADYGSAATVNYYPFIADPDVTGFQTSRWLRNRIKRFCNMSFYIAPSPAVTFEEINVNVTVPTSCKKDPENQPTLIYWDASSQRWINTDEGCFDYPTAIMDISKNIYMAKICKDGSGRHNQSTSAVSIKDPRAYEIVLISRTFPNHPPVIISDTLITEEDYFKEIFVETRDPENDTLIFKIYDQPENAVCIIGNTSGLLNCTLEQDFYGDDHLSIRVTETGLPALEQSLTVSKKLTLRILETPDKTERFFMDTVGSVHEDIRPFLHHTVVVEANRTAFMEVGTIILADVDGGEEFTPQTDFVSLGNSTFTMAIVTLQGGNQTARFGRYRSVQAYAISVAFSPRLNGNMTWNFIAKTAEDEYTPGVTVDLFVLNNPCVFGTCTHPTLGASACESTDRAVSFDGYICVCTPGYEGALCETEMDECNPDPCTGMYDCENLINGYDCNLNVPKLMAILICCIAFTIAAGFGGFKLKGKYQERYQSFQPRARHGAASNERLPARSSLPDRRATTENVHLIFAHERHSAIEVDNIAMSELTPKTDTNVNLKSNSNQNENDSEYMQLQSRDNCEEDVTGDGLNDSISDAECRQGCPSAPSQGTVSPLNIDHSLMFEKPDSLVDMDV